MKKYVTGAVSLLVTAVICSNAAFADSITTNVDHSLPYISVPGVADWATASADMDGMRITATFFGGGVETRIWGTGVNGGVTGTGWELNMSSLTGNTLNTPWIFDSTGAVITSLLIEGAPGNTMFDIQPLIDDSINTTGSRDGVPFADSYVDFFGGTITDSVVSSGVNIVALYSRLVVINSAAPKYDLYSNLLLTFTNIDSSLHGFDAASTLSFIADTDNGSSAPVPEPATMLLFGGGIAGLLGNLLRRKNSSSRP